MTTATVKYFGMLAEKTQCESEELNLKELEGKNLQEFFNARHAALQTVSYTVAVNQEFTNQVRSTDQAIEIALLPPFSGG